MADPAPIEIPLESLSADAARAVIESYILREGTDYGFNELAMETKVANLHRKLKNGGAHLIFDPNSETVTFLTDAEWKKLRAKFPADGASGAAGGA